MGKVIYKTDLTMKSHREPGIVFLQKKAELICKLMPEGVKHVSTEKVGGPEAITLDYLLTFEHPLFEDGTRIDLVTTTVIRRTIKPAAVADGESVANLGKILFTEKELEEMSKETVTEESYVEIPLSVYYIRPDGHALFFKGNEAAGHSNVAKALRQYNELTNPGRLEEILADETYGEPDVYDIQKLLGLTKQEAEPLTAAAKRIRIARGYDPLFEPTAEEVDQLVVQMLEEQIVKKRAMEMAKKDVTSVCGQVMKQALNLVATIESAQDLEDKMKSTNVDQLKEAILALSEQVGKIQ